MRREFTLTLVALALLALTACDKEPASVHDGERYPILFGNYETRATADLDDLKKNGFKVYAYFEGNTRNSHTFEKDVTYSSAQNVWGYEGLEYWIPGATYWFKAFYPTTPSAGTLTVDNTSEAQSFTIADFDISKQEDIMVAETTREGMLVDKSTGAPESGSVVKLQFQHLLANVTIKVLSELATPVDIERIELRDVVVKANYNGNWSAENFGTGNFGIDSDITLNKAESDTDYTDITNGGLLVIPEQVNGTQKLYVKTSFKDYEVSFPTTYSWISGQKYSYTLIIKLENIEFNEPKVEIWDEENATGSVVIK